MEVSNWLRQLSEDKASKVLCWYSVVFAVFYFLVTIFTNDPTSHNYSSNLPIIVWCLVWWNSYKRNFKALYRLIIAWLILQTLLTLYLLLGTSAPLLEFYFSSSKDQLVVGALLVFLAWVFPFFVSKEMNEREVGGDVSPKLRTNSIVGDADVSVDYSLFKSSKNGILQKESNFTQATVRPNQEDRFASIDLKRDAKPTNDKVMNDLEERYKKGRLAIQFRDDAKQGWKKIEQLPVAQKLQYLKWLSDDPKREVESLVASLLEDHRKTIEPFNSDVLNKCFQELSLLSPAAAAEFREIVDTLGDTIDPISVKNTISNRRGKVGKRLVEYENSLTRSLERRWLPDEHFQHLFSDEFQEFVESKSLRNVQQNEAWCLFIEDLYSRCNWDLPNTER